MTREVHPEVVVGAGIAGLLYSWHFRVPCMAAGVSPPPLCAYLHDVPESRKLLQELGMEAQRREVTQQILWRNARHSWPGPPEARDEYFRKSRLHEVEPNALLAGKGETSRFSAAKLSVVYVELWQRLKLEGLLWEVGALSLGRSLDGKYQLWSPNGHQIVADRVKLACPPEAVGVSEFPGAKKRTRVAFDVFRVNPEKSEEFRDLLYVCDPKWRVYRVSRMGHDLLLVEHAWDLEGGTPLIPDDVWEQLEYCVDVDVVKHISRNSSFGFYERQYELPEGVELVGRAASGVPVLTHHLLEAMQEQRMLAEVKT